MFAVTEWPVTECILYLTHGSEFCYDLNTRRSVSPVFGSQLYTHMFLILNSESLKKFCLDFILMVSEILMSSRFWLKSITDIDFLIDRISNVV